MEPDWRQQRKSGTVAIALSTALSLALWFALTRLLPPLNGIESISDRMMLALKCVAVATLFCFLTGIEAIAHERLQGPAFDPLAGQQSRRLQVNLRYTQNTLEQLIIFSVGLFGLAAYLTRGESLRALPALTIIWILNRFAFWIGYHRSAAMRGLGAPSMALGLIVLLYVVARIGGELAGTVGAAGAVALFVAIEAILFWKTR